MSSHLVINSLIVTDSQQETSGSKNGKTGSLDGHSYALESWPKDLKVLILKMLDLPDLFKLGKVSKEWRKLVTMDEVWRPNATAINCPITAGIPIIGQVMGFIKELQEKVTKTLDRGLKNPDVPDDIFKILKRPTIAEIVYLQNWLIARDTLLVWEELAEQRDNLVGPQLENLKNSDEVIAKANEFSAWFTANQNELVLLQELDLSGDQLTSLPIQVGSLTQLQHLLLGSNQLTSLPTWIENFTQLRQLDLADNKLTSLPIGLGTLTQITYLDLSNNQLTSLPTELGNLTQLDSLFVKKNRIASIPTEIFNLAGQMTSFNFKGNPLSEETSIKYIQLKKT
ncbi:MAG: leucine-rich repeat domain-containing protein [Rhabdochlamydiaceae bacterium]